MNTRRTDSTWSCMDNVLPFLAMLMVTCLDITALTIVKAAMNDGMESIVYVVYSNALGTFILLPFFVVHIIRKVDRPALSFRILFRFFILALLGSLFQVLWYVGVDYSSPTMASAILNLCPGITFLIAVLFRIENIDMRSSSSVAKLLGTVMAISGAMVFTFYQGPEIFHTVLSYNLPNQTFSSPPSEWIFGSLITLISVIFACLWIVLLTATAREYPDQQSIIFFYCFFGTVQCIAISPFLVRNRSVWVVQPGIGVTAIVLGAVYSTAFRNRVLAWSFHKKGPLFGVMFTPLSLILAVIMGVTFLGDSLYLGSVIGGMIVATGFYMVMWGQIKEKNKILAVVDDDLDVSDALGSYDDQTAHLLPPTNESKSKDTSMRRTDSWSWTDDIVPFVAMLTITCLDMAVLTIVKSAMNDGLDSIIFVIYHSALGTLVLLPFFVFHIVRTVDRPPLTLHIMFRFFLLGLFGVCFFQELWYVGVDYSSPVMASVISNLSPGVIFLIAVLFRMEKLNLRSSSSVAKLTGTMTAVSGAMVFTFYQGPTLFHTTGSPSSPNQLLFLQLSNWTFGGLIIAIGGTFSCIWIVLHTATTREYSDQRTIVFFYNLFGTIQCIALFPFLGRDRSVWILQSRIMVTAIVLGGVYSVVIRTSILTWCLWKKGPVFTSMFSPLSIVLGEIMGVAFLGDSLHLGSIIGAMIIATGFYIVIWGQTREKKNNNILVVTEDNLDISDEPSSSNQTAHLLSSKNESQC